MRIVTEGGSAGPAALALARAYLLTLWRGHGAAWTRTVAFTALGALAAVLAARNNDLVEAGPRSLLALAILTTPLALAAAAFGGPVLVAEERARSLLVSSGLAVSSRLFAPALALAVLGALLGVTHGAAVAWGLDAPPALATRLAVGGAAWGAAFTPLAFTALRRTFGGDSTVAFFALAVVMAAAQVTVAYVGELAIPAAVAVTLLGAARP